MMEITKNTILFGNGFNLLSKNCPSWHDLLVSISNNKKALLLEGIPPTLQYEQVYISPSSRFKNINYDTEESKLKEAVKNRFAKLKNNEFYDRLRSLDVDVFLTTNYDHAFYDNNEKVVQKEDNTEKLYSIRRWKKCNIDGKDIWLYFIHGDLTYCKSMMLGLDHYGGALAKVQNYVKGNYHINDYDNVPCIKDRLERGLDKDSYGFKESGSGLMSWIDTIFFTNLHIIGMALDFSEIDIWWLLSRRARLSKSNLIRNKIYYYPTFPLSEIQSQLPKLRLLEKLDVEVVYHNITQDIETGTVDYNQIYNCQLDSLEKNLKGV